MPGCSAFAAETVSDWLQWHERNCLFAIPGPELPHRPKSQLRLGIFQKIYTTQFLGEIILHTENA